MARKIKNRWGRKTGSKRSGITMRNSSRNARYAKKVKEYTRGGKLKAVKYFKTASQKRATKTFKVR